MKRIIAIMLLLSLISLIGCSKAVDKQTDNTTLNDPQTQTNKIEDTTPSDSTEVEDEDITPESWGVSVRWTAGKAIESQPFYVNFPKYSGYTEGRGLVAEQLDGTMVIVAAEFDNSPVAENLKDFLPAYFDDVQYTLEKIYGLLSENYQFNVKNDEAVTVGDYDMYSYEGTFSFDDDGEYNEYQFVIYATQLKSNGAYAYWVVYDISDDQSNGALIAEHASNMAKTFREE